MRVRYAHGFALAIGGVAVLCAFFAAPAIGRDLPVKSETPLMFRQLVECRAIADAATRLACYDARVAELDKAAQAKDIVVADRQEVRQARKGLFGFSLPNIGKLFGGDDSGADEVKRIDTTVSSVAMTRSGNLKLVFAEGGTWEQIDTRSFALRPKPGQKAVITKASLGSYYVSVDGQPGIKMRRVE